MPNRRIGRLGMEKKLNFLYSSVHGAYWVYYGVISSFSSVFLLARGFSNSQIGIIIALANILAVIIQPYLADYVDRSRRTAIFSVMASMCIALVLFTNIILVAKNHLVLGTFYVAAFMLQSVMQPFCNGLNRVLEDGGNKIYFGFCRSIGSLVYSIVVVALGYMVDSYTVDIIPKAGILTTLVLLIVVWFSYRAHRQNTLMAGEKHVEHETPAEKINLRAFLKDHRMFFMVNLGVLGLYVGNATVNTFMAQIVRAVGGNNGEVGLVLSVLAFLEVPAMMTFDKYSKRIQCSTLLKFSAVVFCIWLVGCTLSPNVTMLLIVQLTQLCSLAVFLPAMVKYIDENMRKGEEIKGHMLFTTMTTTAGVVTSLMGGFILDIFSAKVLLCASSALTIIGAIFIFMYIDKATEENKERD